MKLIEPVADFYQLQIRVYKILGVWQLPDITKSSLRVMYNIYFWHILLFWLLLWDFSLFAHLLNHIGSLSEIIKVFYIFATALAVLAKYVSSKLHYASFIELFDYMEGSDLLPVNESEVLIFNQAVNLSRKIRNSYSCISLLAANSVLLVKGSSERLPFSFYNPFNIDTEWRYYLLYAYQYIAVIILCFTNIAFDSISSSFFIYLQGQLDILAYRLENVSSNIQKMDMLNQQEYITHQLKDCIRYYHKIMKIKRLVEKLLSMPMSVQIFCSILVLIANFYGIAVLTEESEYASIIKYIIYQFCMTSQIFMLCLFANDVTLKSSELPVMLYNSNWIYWNKTNRRLVLIMMNQFSEPIRINSINRCYSFNLSAFTSIVNSSYSYFALLKNTHKA